MSNFSWKLSVLISCWRNRLRYVFAARNIYRNWWALPLPKFGISVILELRNGLRYLVRARTTDLGTVNEASVLNPYLAHEYINLPQNAIVVDIGANIGDFTMQVAKACPLGRVIAVEPVREHVQMITIQALLNEIENVTTIHSALGKHEGHIDMHVNGSCSSSYWGGEKTETVRLTTLSQLMKELNIYHIDLLKLDCEGAEWEIIPTAESMLPQIKQICMEFHKAQGWTPEKLALWLRERGYKVQHTSGNSWNGFLWATRSKLEQEQIDTTKNDGNSKENNTEMNSKRKSKTV